MKRRSLEDYQRERRGREARSSSTTPGDEERKERVLDHGRDCLRRVKGDTTWEDWMGIGAALMVITEEAMETVGSTVWNKDDRRLVKEFNERWDEYEMSALEKGSNQKPLSKQERWALREVMTNPQIGAWRVTLDGVKRRKLNHPNKVIEQWRRDTQVRDTEPKKPSPSLSQALKEKNDVIGQLEERNRELTEELEGARGSVGSISSSVDQLWAAIVDQLRDEAPSVLKTAMKRFATELSEAWQRRRREGIAASPEPVKKKPGKGRVLKTAFKKAEDDINAALRGLMKPD